MGSYLTICDDPPDHERGWQSSLSKGSFELIRMGGGDDQLVVLPAEKGLLLRRCRVDRHMVDHEAHVRQIGEPMKIEGETVGDVHRSGCTPYECGSTFFDAR